MSSPILGFFFPFLRKNTSHSEQTQGRSPSAERLFEWLKTIIATMEDALDSFVGNENVTNFKHPDMVHTEGSPLPWEEWTLRPTVRRLLNVQ